MKKYIGKTECLAFQWTGDIVKLFDELKAINKSIWVQQRGDSLYIKYGVDSREVGLNNWIVIVDSMGDDFFVWEYSDKAFKDEFYSPSDVLCIDKKNIASIKTEYTAEDLGAYIELRKLTNTQAEDLVNFNK